MHNPEYLQSTQHGFYKVPSTPRFFISADSHCLLQWRGRHVTQSTELHVAKGVVMKFDKLLSVIVRRCEKHVYFKLTNKDQLTLRYTYKAPVKSMVKACKYQHPVLPYLEH